MLPVQAGKPFPAKGWGAFLTTGATTDGGAAHGDQSSKEWRKEAECGLNYRRITRPSGEIVWRCASWVEHGKKFCQHSPSISEDRIKEVLCEKLGLSTFDGDEVKNKVDVILVQSDGSLQIELQCAEYFEMLPN